MRFPAMNLPETRRETLDTFLGYNGTLRQEPGEFADMRNLTSDAFPLLSPRRKRGKWVRSDGISGMIAKDSLCYTDGSCFVLNGLRIDLGLTEGEKQIVSMGAYAVIFPDGKYINTADITDWGALENVFSWEGTVTYSPADLTGAVQLPDYVQPDAPEAPENMALWLDSSTAPGTLMQWSEASAMWTAAAQSFIKIACPGIGAGFRQYDGVTVSGYPEKLRMLEGANVIWDCGEDFLLVPGLLDEVVAGDGICVERRLPRMDFITECGNRLWGCRYGVSREGKPVNEIYASKLGDFRNWSCYMGLTTDSYAVSLGEDGPFTGAVNHMGYPLFFRENCLHKIYGNYPANFRLQTTPCRGVQRGSEKSLAMVGEVLYYKGTSGICAYDGALPVEVGQKLGLQRYECAVGGALGNKYYVSMKDAGGEYRLLVFDSARNLWHIEDGTKVRCFCACRGDLFFLDDLGVICSVSGSGEPERDVQWMAESGDLGAETADSKYLSRVTLRLRMEKGSRVRVRVCYDGERHWEEAAAVQGNGMGVFALPLRVRRCGSLRLRLEGCGECRLLSITKTWELGSDVY